MCRALDPIGGQSGLGKERFGIPRHLKPIKADPLERDGCIGGHQFRHCSPETSGFEPFLDGDDRFGFFSRRKNCIDVDRVQSVKRKNADIDPFGGQFVSGNGGAKLGHGSGGIVSLRAE